jgi:hypothetical protein
MLLANWVPIPLLTDPQYEIWAQAQFQQNDPDRRTMSCALCGRLKRSFPAGAPIAAPDLIEANVGVKYSLEGVAEDEVHHFTAWWDMHGALSQRSNSV